MRPISLLIILSIVGLSACTKSLSGVWSSQRNGGLNFERDTYRFYKDGTFERAHYSDTPPFNTEWKGNYTKQQNTISLTVVDSTTYSSYDCIREKRDSIYFDFSYEHETANHSSARSTLWSSIQIDIHSQTDEVDVLFIDDLNDLNNQMTHAISRPDWPIKMISLHSWQPEFHLKIQDTDCSTYMISYIEGQGTFLNGKLTETLKINPLNRSIQSNNGSKFYKLK